MNDGGDDYRELYVFPFVVFFANSIKPELQIIPYEFYLFLIFFIEQFSVLKFTTAVPISINSGVVQFDREVILIELKVFYLSSD